MDILFNLAFFILVFSPVLWRSYLILPVGVAPPNSLPYIWVGVCVCVWDNSREIAKKFEFNEWEIN